MLSNLQQIHKLYLGYQVTEFGQTCSDINLASITNEDECKKVAKDYGLRYIGRDDTSRNYVPTGCHFYEARDGTDAHWNQNESDTGNEDVKAICKEGIFNHFQK